MNYILLVGIILLAGFVLAMLKLYSRICRYIHSIAEGVDQDIDELS